MLQIQVGAPLQTAEGAKVGRIDGIVIDPLTQDVSHVVVDEGGLTTRKVVVSVGSIRMASEELATLDRDIDPTDLPPLDEVAYSRAEDEPATDRPDAYTQPAQFSSPTVWLSPRRGQADGAGMGADKVTTYNLPDRAVTVDGSTSVVAAGRHHVGSIAGVLATNLGQATHFVLDTDSAVSSLALPAQWIEHVTADEVRLGVTAQLVASAGSPVDALR